MIDGHWQSELDHGLSQALIKERHGLLSQGSLALVTIGQQPPRSQQRKMDSFE